VATDNRTVNNTPSSKSPSELANLNFTANPKVRIDVTNQQTTVQNSGKTSPTYSNKMKNDQQVWQEISRPVMQFVSFVQPKKIAQK